MKIKSLNSLIQVIVILLVIISCKKNDEENIIASNVDYDGNVYDTIRIGTQVWMVENLKTTHYSNGDPIPNTEGIATWGGLSTGAYCNYRNDSLTNIYGRLYNWHAVVDGRNICPKGWHVPSDAEWKILEDYLGMDSAGGKMKETGITHWFNPNTGATNESGLCFLPGGIRAAFGILEIGYSGYWWSSSNDFGGWAKCRTIKHDKTRLMSLSDYKTMGLSIRCLRNY